MIETATGPAATATRCGFIALVGAPNSGKSTLLNRLVGAKVAIVTPKVQTTRTRVLGIALAGTAQLIYVDTPGIFEPKRRLERAMVRAAWRGAADADVILVLVDVRRKPVDDDTARIIEGLRRAGRRAVLVLNKIDLVRRPRLLEITARLNEAGGGPDGLFTDTFMISATRGDGVDDLGAFLAAAMPQGPWLYPEDQLSDLPERLLAAELTREQLFLMLHQELPYSIAVETEGWERFHDGSVKIDQVIYVERPSQKAIVLGHGGARIKKVGTAARTELAALLGCRVHLKLHVSVREDWRERPDYYREMGLEFDA
ncbi:MAG: GTPase Era [Kiloniellales bacterium]